MTNIGKILLILGIGLTAAFGARNPPEIDAQSSAMARAGAASSAHDSALEAYCAARSEAQLEPSVACPGEDQAAGELAADGSLPATAEAYSAWQAAAGELEAASAEVAAFEAPAAGDRLGSWFGLAGLPFLGGLFLVVLGSVLARVGMKAELSRGDSGGGSGGGPVDFGKMLHSLRDQVQAMHAEMEQKSEPTPADFQAAIASIEALQLEAFEPLVEARIQVQTRHGMATFAAIYGPLSGGERFVNRAWAALVDNHWPEALNSLRAATNELSSAASEVPRG